MHWTYERLREDGTVQRCPAMDVDGSVTGLVGQAVINVKAWFDENPAEARRLGWTKHISREWDEIKDEIDYNPQTQILTTSTQQVDEWTIEDTYHVIDKSEEMMRMEALLETANVYVPSGHVILDAQGGVLV